MRHVVKDDGSMLRPMVGTDHLRDIQHVPAGDSNSPLDKGYQALSYFFFF